MEISKQSQQRGVTQMKLTWKLCFVLILTAGLLVACNDDEETSSEPEDADNLAEEEATEPY
jgi:hypothetical protein